MTNEPTNGAAAPPTTNGAAAPLASVYTDTLAQVFTQLNISLVVSTYQAGKVILVRYDRESNTLNTHFRNFEKPMGMAVHGQGAGGRLTIGGQKSVSYLRNMPAVARKLEPAQKHDACYLPREIHITGDIDIHELGYDAEDELWLVNTRFSCLCTLDHEHSFTPRWRPKFVSAYAPEDRCHLNGLALVDGRPKYVTALGETDTPGGWRANKASGGVLIDVTTHEVLLRGLSMPHSPHWHNGRLWFLEGGEGSLAWVDLQTRTWQSIAHLPGFTRGVDFYGPLAFIGLSQVRESATFSGLPLLDRLGEERTCGIWVVNLQTGQTVGFLRFESGVQEIFSVKVLPGIAYPEILEWNDPKMAFSYVLPDAALAETPRAERG
ncbi:MAG: TIGR03032 family protein [Caldilineaceae bacterium]